MIRRTCDWCGIDPVVCFAVPEPAGAVEPKTVTQIDACAIHLDSALYMLSTLTADRPYPTPITFTVIGV